MRRIGCIELGICGGILSSALLLGCSGQLDAGDSETGAIQEPVKNITIDTRRSLAVTEKSILNRFSLQRVLTQLAQQAGTPSVTAVQLFQQWWDTQNPQPGTYAGPHCDDTVDAQLGTTVNGFPYLCRASAEGTQASCDPFATPSACSYIPIGLFNRFDQAPENGALSDTLINVLLPARKAIFEDFLNERPRPSKGPTHPLSGSTSHG